MPAAPFQLPNIHIPTTNLKQVTPDYSGIANFIPQALQAYQTPFTMRHERMMNQEKFNEQAMKNALLKQYGEQEKQAEIASKLAYAQYMMQGGAGGANPYYGKTALAKSMLDQKDIDEGYVPGTNRTVTLTPEEQEQLTGQNQLIMQKLGSDAQTRNKALQASNVMKAFDTLNIKALTKFSGPKGQAKLKIEQAKALAGNPSKEYLDYEEALTLAKTDAKEARQFLGESIQPSAVKALEGLSNPTGLLMSPEAAEKKMNAFRNVLRKQLHTYSKGLKSPAPYREGAHSPMGFEDQQDTYLQNQQFLKQNRTFNSTDPDVLRTAQKRGMSPQQVAEMLNASQGNR